MTKSFKRVEGVYKRADIRKNVEWAVDSLAKVVNEVEDVEDKIAYLKDTVEDMHHSPADTKFSASFTDFGSLGVILPKEYEKIFKNNMRDILERITEINSELGYDVVQHYMQIRGYRDLYVAFPIVAVDIIIKDTAYKLLEEYGGLSKDTELNS
ncbi:hypothetical protein 000TH008_95 [Bacillus phage 000TH008]|nr:hypothetical protein 000TH008_95 [Bacillus phage 000TH008]QQO40789.1 hypothetical protein 000TH009_95 [Bacillus phage 000TH009]